MISILFLFFGLAFLVGIVATIIEILKSEFKDSSEKTIFIMMIVLMPLVGLIVYYSYGRSRRIAHAPSEYV